uniref:Aminopeptidase N n=1 Tax=Timema poppense TaxID=170557 RepID=A0A7R9GV46_TIMPO|nr:unnamed protein product [Timema poppensis]
MSTYLVAFVVSDFEKTSEDSVSIWHRPGLQSQALYSASVSPKIIDKLEEFTGVSYHLPKMDEVAVPDFSAGAMENWGLVTYRERALLFEEGVSTSSYKQSIATVIAHEFGHQWFGDLVGPRWWSYLWLNEGFATYFEFFATALVETTWRLEEQFVVREVHSAFSADASEWSHPMTYDVYSPTEIGNIFDSISYAKAGSVIRMMEHILTTETFKGGLNLYLNANGNDTAEANDLFKALEEQYKEDFPNSELSDEELQDVFESWTLQMGYPVITVTRDYALGTVNVNQERFLLTDSSSTDDHDYKWWVPLTFTTKTEKDFTDTTTKEWLKRTEENKQLTTLTPVTSDWVLFNIQQTGFYRVNYDTTNWKLLISQLNSDQYEVIPPVNRAQLLDDAFNLARAGLLDYSTLFSLTDYLARETDYIPWYAAFNGFSFLNTRLNKASDSEYSVFKNYVLSLLEKVYATLGFEEKTTDGHVDRLNRNLILTWACRLGHADCILKATQHFNAFISDQNANKVAPDLQSVVYCNGLWYSDGAGFDVLWEKAQSTDVSTEQVLILGILGCTAHEDSAHKYINQSYSEETPIRQQDISLVLSSVTSYGNVDFLTSYIQKHYQDRSPSQVRSLISSAANLLRSEDQFSKLEDFVQSNKVYLNVTDEQATSLLSSYHTNKAWATTTGSTILTQVKQQIYRLPTTISPVNYVIKLTPHLEEDRFNFDGEVTITINVAEYTNQIVLHASDMAVDTAATQVTNSGGTVQTINSHETNELRETYTITLMDSLVVGQQYNVYIKFLGNLRDDMYGFYRSYYTVGGVKSICSGWLSERLYVLSPVRWLASTQFESTYARRAFPCFDEPALKATFQINIGRSSTYTSVSNMKIERTDTSDPNLVWDIYKTTPVMSTYLLAFLVSDFEKTENDAQDTSVWHRADAASQASYSIGVSRPLIDAMVAFTGVTFELEKMDQAAIPDFSAGAMENWGLVTYRERLILFDETVSTSADKQGIATTIAHEFAHQWFGNLVSPRWWSYAWLNEGFATYFEWFITAEVEKDWRIEDQFVIKEVQVALAADCLESSHPMTNLVNSPSDISSIFDSISYAKGGHHNTAEANDLFTALHTSFLTVNPTSEINVMDIMNTWTTQMGYPVITVNRNYDTGRTARVKQERFLLTTSADSSDDHDYKWWIPLTFTTNASKDFTTTQTQIWLKASENETDLTDIAANYDWVIFNKQQIGFYRVNYDDTNWNLIISHLNSDQFTNIHVLLPLYRFLQSFYRVNYDDTNWNLIISHLNSDHFTDIYVLLPLYRFLPSFYRVNYDDTNWNLIISHLSSDQLTDIHVLLPLYRFLPSFYRVNYDDTNWNLIISHLNSDQFTDIHVLLPLYRFLPSLYRVNYDDTNWNLIIFHLTVTSSLISNRVNYDDTNWNLIISHLSSFYRVNYDDTNWNLIISHLNSDQFTDIHVLLPLYRFLPSFYRVNYDDTNWNLIISHLTVTSSLISTCCYLCTGFYRVNYDDTNCNLIISHLNCDQFTDIHVLLPLYRCCYLCTGFYRVNYDDTNWNLIISHLNSDQFTDIHVLLPLYSFYRVNYDYTNWNMIISHLNSDQFTDIYVLNRAQILDDSLNLARAGILDYTTALNITKYLSREDDYIPWYSAFTAFSFLDARLIGVEEEYQFFKKANETHTDKLLRNLVLTWACNLGLESCVSAAKEKLAQKIASPSNVTIPADVSSVVYCTALREGGGEEWTFLKAQYDSSNVGTEQVLLLTALGCSTGTQIITNYLDLSISADSGIRKQDASRVFSAVYANPSGVDIAFQFLTENYQKISEFYGGLGTIGSILKGIAARISTQEQLIKLQNFVVENEAALGDAVTASKQAIETAQANLDWVASNRAALVTWLREQSPAAPEVTTLFIPTTTQGATCITISTTLIYLSPKYISQSEMLRVETAIIFTFLSWTLSSAHLYSPSSSSDDTTATTQYRLPGDVIPRSYVIKLIPKLYDDFVFNGTVEMTTEVVENTGTVTFHIDDLEIDEDSVVVRNIANDTTVAVTNQTFDEVHNFYTLTLDKDLEKGNEYSILINYNGHHRDDMRGFYRSSYVNSTGDTVWLASTHFEPVRARRAFPCFDEPALKAKFQISIAVPEGLPRNLQHAA